MHFLLRPISENFYRTFKNSYFEKKNQIFFQTTKLPMNTQK